MRENKEVENKVYIGDNISFLKDDSFKKYYNKIKMIYIDPPYNTKTIKAYNDKRKEEEWAMFIKERLVASYDLLTEDGCIFISIDDNEYAELKMICDEIYGKKNHIGTFITYQALRSNSKLINTVHEYVLCYAKNKKKVKDFKILRKYIDEDKKIINEVENEIKKVIEKEGIKVAKKRIKTLINEKCKEYNISWLKNYNNVDDEGRIYFAMDLSTPGQPRKVDIEKINLHLKPLKTRGWSSDEKFIDLYKRNLIVFKDYRPYEKHYLDDACDNVTSIMRFFSRNGTNDLKKLGLYNLFDAPKPVEMIKFLIRISTNDNDYIMDFFAGSGTTAQSVCEVNIENNRNNKFILIQKKEKFNEKSQSFEVCNKLGIKPYTNEALIYRLNTYLKTIHNRFSYDLIEEKHKAS